MSADEDITDGNTMTVKSDPPSYYVIKAVADAENTSIDDLPPLYETMDGDAIDKVVQAGANRLSFDYAGYTVEIHGPEDVTVTSVPDS